MSLIRDSFKVCVDLLVAKGGPGKGSFVLCLDKGIIMCVRPKNRPKDSIKIAHVSVHDLTHGCTSAKWDEISTSLVRLIEGGQLK